MKGAQYEVVSILPDQITIRDIGHNRGRKTVTNDAEAAIQSLANLSLLAPGRRLFYLDSNESKDEILIGKDGKFAGFRSIATDVPRR